MTSLIDLALDKVSLVPRPYTEQELEAAEIRIAARLTSQLVSEALSFDDEVRPGWHRTLPPRLRSSQCHACRAETVRDLETLCRTVVEREGALQHMSAFLSRRILQPDGARVLGCVLQLAGREDSARFWWQFAAGAGDVASAYCLYLHHLALGEVWEAELWHKQAAPEHRAARTGRGERDGRDGRDGPSGPDLDPELAPDVDAERVDAEQEEDGSSPGLVLRVLARLRGDGAYLTAAAAAVIHYVPEAVQFVDEIELPLPAADFAERIEELTATA